MTKITNCLSGISFFSPPIWIMRQAGRYLPEFRKIRATYPNFFDLCFTPKVVKEVTLQPIQRFDLDAAIIFSDILVIPLARGQKVEFIKGEGPVLGPLNNNKADLTRLNAIYEAILLTRETLPKSKDLIGFAGAPWTIATYMIEEGKSKNFDKCYKLLKNSPQEMVDLIESLTFDIIGHLLNQIKAGANVVQIFDSWAGSVPEEYTEMLILNPIKKILKAIKGHAPVIFFGRGASHLYPFLAEEMPDLAFGLDESVSLKWARAALPQSPLQGNLDPKILLEGGNKLKHTVNLILDAMKGHPFIFNLGHGILPETPVSHVEELLRLVRND